MIVVTSPMNFLPEQRKRLEDLGDVVIYDTLPASLEEWLERCKGRNIICSGKYGLTEGIYENKDVFYSLPFVGVGWLDKEKLKENGITVSYCPGCNSFAVSEWIVGMTFNLMRKLNRLVNTEYISDKTGSPEYLGLAGKKACILGKGNIGSKVGKMYESAGITVDYFGRGENLIEKVKNCGIIVNTLGSNESTENLLNKEFFESLESKPYFLTVTSSKIYDSEAMLNALDNGKLSGVANDCGSILPGNYEDEYYKKLIKNPKVLATPHIAYQSDVTIKVSNDMMIDNVEAWIKGEPINLV